MADRKAKGQRLDSLTPPKTDPTPTAPSAVQHSDDTDLPTVAGLIYGPCPGRRRFLILVRRCCHCGYAHRHTSELLAATYVRGCRPTGRPYRVRARVERDTGRAVRHA